MKTTFVWKHIHQPWEFKFHRDSGIPKFRVNDELFSKHCTAILGDFLELQPNAFGPNDYLIDIGCGPRPFLAWFQDGIKVCIDPLLTQYLHLCKQMKLPWWEGQSSYVLYSLPAERGIQELRGKGKFILCWNTLQHTYNWKKIVENIYRYARRDSIICIATEFGTQRIGHPANIGEDEFMKTIVKYFVILKTGKKIGEQDIALKLCCRANKGGA